MMEKILNNKWLKVGLLSVAGLFLAVGLVFAGVKLGQKQVQPAPQPTIVPTPKATGIPTLQMTPSPKARREVEIGARDNGSQVLLEAGQTLVLRLASNPSTGYGWEIAEIDKAVLKQTHYEHKQDRPLFGSGGEDIWHFQAQAKGRMTLTLNYGRPWEEMEPAFSVEIMVR